MRGTVIRYAACAAVIAGSILAAGRSAIARELLYHELNGAVSGFLSTYDAQTWELVDFFPGTNNPSIGGMVYDPSTDILFAYETYRQLGYMDRATGRFIRIGRDNDFLIEPIALQPGTFDLFGLSFYGDLYKIDKTTGVPTLVGGDPIFNAPHAMAFSPDGTLYATDNGPRKLLTIDPATGKATRVAEINRPIIDSLAFNSAGVMYGLDANSITLVSIDPTTGNATAVRTGIARGAIAFVIPEPATMVMLSAGAIALGRFRRRRSVPHDSSGIDLSAAKVVPWVVK